MTGQDYKTELEVLLRDSLFDLQRDRTQPLNKYGVQARCDDLIFGLLRLADRMREREEST